MIIYLHLSHIFQVSNYMHICVITFYYCKFFQLLLLDKNDSLLLCLYQNLYFFIDRVLMVIICLIC